MNANLRLPRRPRAEFRLVTKLTKRTEYAAALALLGVSMGVGWDPARDLSAERAPWTVLYIAVMAGCLVGTVAHRVVTVGRDPRVLSVERRVAGLVLRTERHLVAEDAVVWLQSGRRPRFVLSIRSGGAVVTLDGSSWKSELEPMARALAAALGVGYEG